MLTYDRPLMSAPPRPLRSLATLLTLLAACDMRVPFEVRIETMASCIECLDACRELPYPRLFPHKKRVLRALEVALDHKKRRVRQAACKCANQWHMLKAKAR